MQGKKNLNYLSINALGAHVPDRTMHAMTDHDELHQVVLMLYDPLNRQRANYLTERAGKIQLGQQLNEATKQLASQKDLHDTRIEREKETRAEKLHKHIDTEPLMAKIIVVREQELEKLCKRP